MENLSRKEKEQLMRRNYILSAAKKVFAKDGYDGASMNEIASLSEFTKRTIYQYFIDKADLYLTVLIIQYSNMEKELASIETKNLNGYEIIKSYLYTYYHYYKEHEETFRILYDFGKVRTLTSNPKIKDVIDIDLKITEYIYKSIVNGQSDGSISKKIDASNKTHTLKFLITGFFNQMTITGTSYTKHIQVSQEDFVHDALDHLLIALKA